MCPSKAIEKNENNRIINITKVKKQNKPDNPVNRIKSGTAKIFFIF